MNSFLNKIHKKLSPIEFIIKSTDLNNIFRENNFIHIYNRSLRVRKHIYNLITSKSFETKEDFDTLEIIIENQMIPFNKVFEKIKIGNQKNLENYIDNNPNSEISSTMRQKEIKELGELLNKETKIKEKNIFDVSSVKNMEDMFFHSKTITKMKNIDTEKKDKKIYIKKKDNPSMYGSRTIKNESLYIDTLYFAPINSDLTYSIVDNYIYFYYKDKEVLQKINFDRDFFFFIRELDEIKRKNQIY